MKKIVKMITVTTVTMVTLSVIYACSKDDSGDIDKETKLEKELDEVFLLGTWAYESITADTPEDYNGDGNKSTDILLQYTEDQKDNIFRFILNGTKYEILDRPVTTAKVLEKGRYKIVDDNIVLFNSENNEDITTFKKVQALQDNYGQGEAFLKYQNENGYWVLLKDITPEDIKAP